MKSYQPIQDALKAIAQQCDGARAQDGVGFNGAHAGIARSYISRPVAEWTPKMALMAWTIAQTYQGQLRRLGINTGAIQRPHVKEERRKPRNGKRVQFKARMIDMRTIALKADGFPGQIAVGAVKTAGGKWNPRNKTWTISATKAEALLAMFKDNLIEENAKVQAVLRGHLKQAAEAVRASTATEAELVIPGLGGELRPYQKAGVVYGMGRDAVMYGDAPGLGKTPQALALLKARNLFPAVVVCPATLKFNWMIEAKRWIPGLKRVEVLSGKKPFPIPRDAGLVVLNYDILEAWVTTLHSWGPKAFVADESHKVKNYRAKRTKSLQLLADKIDVRILLTGTAVVNAPIDFWSQVKILGYGDELGGWRGFTERYCIKGKFGGFEQRGRNLRELNTKIRSLFYIRREKNEVLADLPEKRRNIVTLELPPGARRTYQDALKKAAQHLRRARMEKLLAEQEGRPVEGWALAAGLKNLSDLTQVTARLKLKQCVQWIEGLIEQGEKVIVFAEHVAIVEGLQAALDCDAIRGGMKAERKQAAVERFQNDALVKALVLNLQAGSEGLTLTAAANVVFIQWGWTPSLMDQAEDRAHRFGQTREVDIWYLAAHDTIDPWRLDHVAKKRPMTEAALDGDAGQRAAVLADLEAKVLAAAGEDP